MEADTLFLSRPEHPFDTGRSTGQNECVASHRELYGSPTAMEPLFPSYAAGHLKELAAELLRKSARLGGALHPVTRERVVELLRAMNSYYSNLIEGHQTHPLAIERALRNDYASDPALRALQLESKAHIEVQLLIEDRLAREPEVDVGAQEFIHSIHREFYKRLPEEFQWVKTRGGQTDRVLPGELRSCEVEVGHHVAPHYPALPRLLSRFAQGYRLDRLDPLERIVGVAASHHRLVWIHPYLDGNGRVARLLTHAFLIRVQVDGHRLWMVSRGLARQRQKYLAALAAADASRQGDLDGRGNLSDKGLSDFCRFFLETAIDQVDFMSGLLDLDSMQQRMGFAIGHLGLQARFGAEVEDLLRDVFLRGSVSRGEATGLLRKPERTARRTIGALLEEGLLVSPGPRGRLEIGFPLKMVGYYFPRLYPEGVEMEIADLGHDLQGSLF